MVVVFISRPKIAQSMGCRTGKQCRERYINQLDPDVKKSAWSVEENNLIISLFPKFGTRWSQYLPYLPGRSDNAIKNRYHVIRKRDFEEECPSERVSNKRSLADHLSLGSDAGTSKDESSADANRNNLRKLWAARYELDREIGELQRNFEKQNVPHEMPTCSSEPPKTEGLSPASSTSDLNFDFDWVDAEQSGP